MKPDHANTPIFPTRVTGGPVLPVNQHPIIFVEVEKPREVPIGPRSRPANGSPSQLVGGSLTLLGVIFTRVLSAY